MGLLDLIFSKKEKTLVASNTFKTFNAYTPVFSSWNGKLYESELVRASCDAKARHIAKLKVEMRGSANKPLQTKVKHQPNNFQTWSQFLYRLSTILDVDGTAFIVPVSDRLGDICGYYPILPSQTSIVEFQGVQYLRYQFSTGGIASVELEKCGIMTRHQYRDDFFGTNNVALKPTMDLMNIQNQGIQENIKNGASFRFMAKLTNFAKPEDIKKERENFTEQNLKTDSGGFLLFPNTYDSIQQIQSRPYPVNPEQIKIIQTNVFNYFGVNEKILQNSAFGDDLDAFYEGAIEPFAIQLSEVLTKMTFTQTEQSYGAEIIVNANRLQYMRTSDKIALAREGSDRGWLTIDEIRDLLDYPRLEGEEGSKRPVRGEYYFVDDEGNMTSKQGDNNNGSEE